jgi:hypothetical protein
VSPCHTGTSPSKCPSAGAELRTSTPTARALRVPAFPQQAPARLRALVGEHDVSAELGRRDRGAEAGVPGADDEHVGVAAAVLGAPAPLGLFLGQAAQSRGVAQDPLIQRPQPPRADERLVIEARGGERPAELVGERHRVELEPGAGVQMLDPHPLARGLGASANAGRAVDRHHAVRAVAGTAQQTATPVVLEAAGEGAASRCEQRGGDRVALERRNGLAVEAEGERFAAHQPLAGLRRQPAHASSPGSPTRSTSLVRVSRSAWNHVRHPERWYHHSR